MPQLTTRQKRRQLIREELQRAIAGQYHHRIVVINDSTVLGPDYLAILSRVVRAARLRVDSFGNLGPSSTVIQTIDVLMRG